MSKIALDMKKFKHLKSDSKGTHLKHEDGHVLIIAHKGLSPEGQEQMKALAKVSPAKKNKALASGGTVESGSPTMNYDEGGEVDEFPNKDNDPAPTPSHFFQPGSTSVPMEAQGPATAPIPTPSAPSPQDQLAVIDQKLAAMKNMPYSGANTDARLQLQRQREVIAPTKAAAYTSPYQQMNAPVDRTISNKTQQAVTKGMEGWARPAVQAVQNYTGLADGGVIPKSQMKTSNKIIQPGVTDKAGAESRPGENVFGKKQEVAPTQGGEDYKRKMASRPKYAEKGEVTAEPEALDPNGDTEAEVQAANAEQHPPMSPGEQAQWGQFAQAHPNTAPQQQLATPEETAKRETTAAAPAPGKSPDAFMQQLRGVSDEASQPGPPAQQPDPTKSTAPTPTDPSTWQGMPSYEQGVAKWYNLTKSSIATEEQAQVDKAKNTEGLLAANQSVVQGISDKYAQSVGELNQERKNHIQDIQDGYIDPNKYWTGDKNGNGSHSRIAAGIGMILAGFNPASQPNAALNFLNHQMEQNLAAQKENLSAKQNLLAANLRQFGNLKDATDMTRVMQNDVVNNQLQTEAAKAANPMAKAAALKASGELAKQASDISLQMGMRKMLTGLAGGTGNATNVRQSLDYMEALKPGSTKEYRERFIPGMVGTNGGAFASNPVPDAVRTALGNMDNLDASVKDLQNYIKQHPVTMWGSKESAEAATKARAIQAYARDGLLHTVYREGEQPVLDQFLSADPTSLASFYTTPTKLNGLLNINRMGRESIVKPYGLRPDTGNVIQQRPQNIRFTPRGQ